MALTAEDVRVAVTGGVYGAPDGTTLPTDADAALDAAFDELGYVSEDGITQAINSDVTDIRAWQNGDIVRKVQTSHDLTYAMAFLETNEHTLATYYGDYTGDSDAGTVEIRGTMGIRQSWVFNVVDGDARIRLVIPDGQVTERGEISYVNGDAIMYPVTITAYPDASGVKAYLYYDNGEAS
jgi:hypothetical protein